MIVPVGDEGTRFASPKIWKARRAYWHFVATLNVLLDVDVVARVCCEWPIVAVDSQMSPTTEMKKHGMGGGSMQINRDNGAVPNLLEAFNKVKQKKAEKSVFHFCKTTKYAHSVRYLK